MELFEAKVKRIIVDEKTGKDKKVTEKYLVNALTCTEAEAVITKEMKQIHTEDFNIPAIKQSNINEIDSENEGAIFYIAKIGIIGIDDDSGKEKKTITRILTLSDTVDGAYNNINKLFTESVSDYVIEAVTDSKIQDYVVNN